MQSIPMHAFLPIFQCCFLNSPLTDSSTENSSLPYKSPPKKDVEAFLVDIHPLQLFFFGELRLKEPFGTNCYAMAALGLEGMLTTRIREGKLNALSIEAVLEEEILPAIQAKGGVYRYLVMNQSSTLHRKSVMERLCRKFRIGLIILPLHSQKRNVIRTAFIRAKDYILDTYGDQFVTTDMLAEGMGNVTISMVRKGFHSCGYKSD